MQEKKLTSAFRYAIGMFGTSIPINMFKTYASAYYVINRGLGTDQLAAILFWYTFVDALDNPVYGFLSDRTRTKWGRRRVWLVIGTPLLIVFFILFFSAPESLAGGSNALFAYAMLTYILTGTLDSLINANYGALFPELFVTDEQRAKANGMRQMFQLVAMGISIALTPMITEQIGYQKTAVIYGLLAGAVILYCTFGCRESTHHSAEKPQLWGTIKAILINPKFWIFGLTNAFFSGGMAMVLSGIPFFTKYTLKLENSMVTVLMAAVLVSALVGIVIWVQLVKRIDPLKLWQTALLLFGLCFIPLYFANNLISAAVICALAGLCGAGIIATMDLMGARIMDEDTARSGLRREGAYASTLGFMNRLNGLFSSAAMLIVYHFYGFESGDVPGDRPGDAARFLLVVAPFVLIVLGVICSRFMYFGIKGEEKHPVQNEAEAILHD